jgi:hypothetical protein
MYHVKAFQHKNLTRYHCFVKIIIFLFYCSSLFVFDIHTFSKGIWVNLIFFLHFVFQSSNEHLKFWSQIIRNIYVWVQLPHNFKVIVIMAYGNFVPFIHNIFWDFSYKLCTAGKKGNHVNLTRLLNLTNVL